MGKNKSQKRELLKAPSPIIDTHCHLDYLEDVEDLKDLLKKCEEVNVEKMVTISVEPTNLDVVLEIAKDYPNIFCTQGIHPHEARHFNDGHLEKIRKNATDANVKAIGEIGLDYYYDHSPREIQRQVFEKQLELAVDLQLPVVVHAREADDDMISILGNVTNQLKDRLVIHSFSSGLDLAEFALNHDFFLGFNGMLTFQRAENVRAALKMTPLDRVMLETDSPFLAPHPFRGKENAPFLLPFVAERMATEHKKPLPLVLEQVYETSVTFFGLY